MLRELHFILFFIEYFIVKKTMLENDSTWQWIAPAVLISAREIIYDQKIFVEWPGLVSTFVNSQPDIFCYYQDKQFFTMQFLYLHFQCICQ